MTTPRILGEARIYDEVIELYRARKTELGLTDAALDYLSGLQSGYSGKLFGAAQTKTVGPLAFGLLNETLAVRFVMVEDVEAAARMEPKWEKRERPANVSLPQASKKAIARFMPIIQREISKRGASLGGIARAKKLTKSARRRIARIASRARWDRHRAS